MEELEWFESIHNRYADFCFNLGKHLLYGGSDEDVLYDVVQEVFLTLWTKRKELMNHPNIGGWLSLTVRYRMMSTMKERRKHDQQQAFSLDEENIIEVSSPQLTPEQQTDLWGRMDALRELLGEEDTLLFLAYAVSGYKAKELGARFGLTENCVHMRISRMKKKITAHPEMFYVMLLISIGAFKPF